MKNPSRKRKIVLSRLLWGVVSCLFVAFFSGQVFAASSLLLSEQGENAQQGKALYTIVLADAPTAIEQTAAKELKTQLEEITGAVWTVLPEKDVPENAAQILLGDSARARKLFPEIKFEDIPYDGIVLKSRENAILLCGHPQRGTLYAVNTFLEDTLGVRWWTSTEKFVPNKPRLEIPALDHQYAPKLIYREAYYKDAFEPLFATRMKCNGANERIPDEYGGHHEFMYFVHSFYPLIPPEKYFQDHPEWFSEVGGKRSHDRKQLCLTNEEMCRELTKNAKDALRRRPQAKFISISQNDWYGYCECEKCKKLAEEEGAQSGPLIHFVNKVAEEIEKEFPDVWVETLAYQYTRKPPKHVKPRDNVVIRLCTIECSFVQPLTGEQNASLCEDMQGWSKIAKQLFVWDYITNFTSYMIPHPNLRVLAPNIRFFVDHGTIGLFEQGDAYCTVGDFVRMRNWVVSKLMWDPSLDENKLRDEFLVGYYGEAAAPYLREYFDTLLDKAESSGKHIGCFRPDTSEWLDLDTLNKATQIFNRAISETEKKLGADSLEAQRLVRERIPLDHVWLNQYYSFQRQAKRENKPFLGPSDPIEECKRFFEVCDKYKVAAYREFNRPEHFEEFRRNMYTRFGPPAPAPEIVKDLPEMTWIDYQEYDFNKANPGVWVSIVDDANASNKRTAKMPGDHHEWATAKPLTQEVFELKSSSGKSDTPGTYRLYAFVRCDATTEEGFAMSFGVYDEKNGKSVAMKNVFISQIKGERYTMIELGRCELSPNSYVWFAPPKRPGEVQAVYIDRLVIVRE